MMEKNTEKKERVYNVKSVMWRSGCVCVQGDESEKNQFLSENSADEFLEWKIEIFYGVSNK